PAEAGSAGAITLDPRTYSRALSCVHCGLCLPACPTYTETGHEADSPRGRIQLMRGLADGLIEPTASVKKHLDLCLDCRGCETACPSGVVYHELIEETRARLAERDAASGKRPDMQARLMQWLFFHVFTHPRRLKLALLPARILQKLGIYPLLRKSGLMKVLPAQLRKMEQMLPPTGALWPKLLPERVVFSGGSFASVHNALTTGLTNQPSKVRTTKATVGFFPGCIGSVMFDSTNRKAVELLAACGAEVVVPRAQGCCGAIHHHNGVHHPAELMARDNIDAFLPKDAPGVDFIVTNIAGCGAMLREYDLLLRDDADFADRATEFTKRVRDISEVLVDLGLPPMQHAINETITYHDACHLAHAQKVVNPPRQLLAQIPGLKLAPLPESDMCCGAAGTYNLQHPEMATALAARKLSNIATTGATTCVTGNVGCAMHIGSEAAARGQAVRVIHPIELLHFAVFGPGRKS
ncbi:MAG: heterodisulfide reductase-related iron-sulfur binding cluster, partial [Tepidisphaeraceae bacterium]